MDSLCIWVQFNSYQNIDDLHEIASDKLLHLLTTNKGLYIKLGQAIANQGNLFPLIKEILTIV